jgi:AcrR family transcriptional regulator
MLNSVSDHSEAAAPVRRRLSADERRRQLVAIGLAKIVETPIQDLSMDDIAAEAGISRGLLFHYFPTKTDFYLACIAAAGRRMLRTTAPDEDLPGEQQVEMTTRLMVEQIERRRDFYLALVHGHGVADPRVSEVMDSVRQGSTDRVVAALGVPARQHDVVRAWWAYTEDRPGRQRLTTLPFTEKRALSSSGTPSHARTVSRPHL